MSRVFTEQDRIKLIGAIKAAAQLQREKRENRLKIGDYELYRWDNMNWVMQHKNGRISYFSTLENALDNIPKKLINSVEYTDAAQLLAEIKKWREEVKTFLWTHLETLKKDSVDNS